MVTAPEHLSRARQLQQRGNHHQAERLYRQALAGDSQNPELWHRLGIACQEQGKLADATACYQRALKAAPDSCDVRYDLAVVLARRGHREDARDHYERLLRTRPNHADALTNLGVLLAEQGELQEAITRLREAVRARPDFAKAHHNLGVALTEQGNLQEAADCLRQAQRCRPDYAPAYYGLGNVLSAQGQRDEAMEQYREALRLRPDYAEAYNNLGLALLDAGKPAEALVLLQQGVRLRPDEAEAHNNLGLALAGLGRFDEAEACYQQALRLNPRYAEAHNNLASAFKGRGRMDEALAAYQVSLWLNPDSASTHWNRALTWLQMGRFEQGWPEYEWRWRRKRMPPRPFAQPRWDGAPLGGRTILLYREQGLGDLIQFVRYAPLVQRGGGRVLVECPPPLARLFATCPGIDQVLVEGSPWPQFDVQAALLSLPALFGTSLASVPRVVPYLFPGTERVEAWRRQLGALDGFKVGVAWQGNPRHPGDLLRSFPLAQLAPLARVPGVRLVSLQRGPGSEQLLEVGERVPVTDTARDPVTAGDFLDTAALMKNLDLVISTDTAVAHLAGALGLPVWVALSTVPDWRWLLKREDSPWYPTMRLFRQRNLGDWDAVFGRMATELSKLAPAGPGRGG
jgi:tetratricopeptide (TPR) repeat protein